MDISRDLQGAIQLEILEQLKQQNEVIKVTDPHALKVEAYKKLLEPKPFTTFGNSCGE